MRHHGRIVVDLDGRGGLMVKFPDGTTASANHTDHARALAEGWLRKDALVNGEGMGKIEWHNGANYWKGAPGSEQKRVAGEARLIAGRVPAPLQVRPVVDQSMAVGVGRYSSPESNLAPEPLKYVRLIHHRSMFGQPYETNAALVIAEPLSAIEVNNDEGVGSITMTRARDGHQFTRPLRVIEGELATEVYRVEVSARPWVTQQE